MKAKFHCKSLNIYLGLKHTDSNISSSTKTMWGGGREREIYIYIHIFKLTPYDL